MIKSHGFSFLGAVAAGVVLIATSLEPSWARTFTNTAGRKIEAEIVEVNGDNVVLKMNGKNYPVPISSLSAPDQEYIKKWTENKSSSPAPSDKPVGATLGNFDGLRLGNWPGVIEAGDDGKEYKITEKDGGYIYQSPHFEFHIGERLSFSVVKEFARIFEATYQFLDDAPFGLAPTAAGNGYYQTKLYLSRQAYMAEGGSLNSGGQFSYSYSGPRGKPAEIKFKKAIIKIPMTSLGVEYTGTRYIIDHDKQNKTLIHEIVHQVMMRWLPVMPVWMSEGFAEFVESQDYSKGKYRTKMMTKAVKENVLSSGREFYMVPIERLMTISSQEWSAELGSSLSQGRKNYKSSNLLLTYFALLDGDGKGEGLVNYLKAVSTGVDQKKAVEEALLRGRSYEELQNDVTAAWREEGIKLYFD